MSIIHGLDGSTISQNPPVITLDLNLIPKRFFHRTEVLKDSFNAFIVIDEAAHGLPHPGEGFVYVMFASKIVLASNPNQAIALMRRTEKEKDPKYVDNIAHLNYLRTQAVYPLAMPAPNFPMRMKVDDLIDAEECGLILTDPVLTGRHRDAPEVPVHTLHEAATNSTATNSDAPAPHTPPSAPPEGHSNAGGDTQSAPEKGKTRKNGRKQA